MAILNALTSLKHVFIEPLLNLDLEVFVLEGGASVSVDADTCKHSTIIWDVIAVLSLRSRKATHEAVERELD